MAHLDLKKFTLGNKPKVQQVKEEVTSPIPDSSQESLVPKVECTTETMNSQENSPVETAQIANTADQPSAPSVAQVKTSSTIQPQTTANIDADKEAVTFRLKQAVDELSKALLDKHPSMANLLREIHRTVKSYPEQVTILTEEELNQIFVTYEEMSKITLAASQTAKRASDRSLKSQIKNLGVNAF